MPCEVCDRDSEDRVCVRCRSRIRGQLNDFPTFFDEALSNLVPARAGGSRGNEIQVGIRLDALDFVSGFNVLPGLEEWEKDFRRFFGLSAFGPVSLERGSIAGQLHGTVGFLMAWLDRVCEKHPAVEDFSREVGVLWREAQAAAGDQPRSAWSVTCPADTVSGECSRRIRVTGEDFGSTVSCSGCGTVWRVDRLLMVVASSKHAELWLDPEAASRFYGIPVRDLRRWAQAGRIRRERNRYESHSIRAAIAGVA